MWRSFKCALMIQTISTPCVYRLQVLYQYCSSESPFIEIMKNYVVAIFDNVVSLPIRLQTEF